MTTYAESYTTAKEDAKACAARWGGTWGVAEHPERPGLYMRAMVGYLPSPPLYSVRVPLNPAFDIVETETENPPKD